MKTILKKPGKAIILSSLGINHVAWKYEDVLIVLDNLMDMKAIILGGDVFVYTNGIVQSTCDSWYYERKSPLESIEISKDYIKNYYNRNGTAYCYSLTILFAKDNGKYEL